MKQNRFWLKPIGVAFLVHVALIVISVVEVAIYSYAVAPDREEAFYEAHAQISGPWVSGICGSLIMFLLVRRFIRKNDERHLTYTIALPAAYIILDILMLLPFGINWAEHLPIFLMANGPKIATSFVSYLVYKPSNYGNQNPTATS